MTETQYEELGERMLKVYSEAEQRMLRSVANRLARGVDQPGWTEFKASQLTEARKAIQAALADAHREGIAALDEAVTTAYGDSQRRWMMENKDAVRAMGVLTLHPNSEKVALILSDLDSRMDAAERNVLRRFDDNYSRIIGETAALVASGGYTQRAALQESMQRFADEGISGFTDKAGRHWELPVYAEMALLTAIEKASVQGYIDTMESYGYDLAIISEHEGACPLCEAWQGVVVSISGKNEDYPSLSEAEDAGVFHPRCMHDLATYHEAIDRGKYRSEPREVKEPSEAYSARSTQRYMERQIRHYKNRMAAATNAQAERQAYNKVREWQGRIREHLMNYRNEDLPRKYWREGGPITMRFN